MKLSELVTEFITKQRPNGQLLDDDCVKSQAVAAVRFYIGYGSLGVPLQADTPQAQAAPATLAAAFGADIAVIDSSQSPHDHRLIPQAT